MEDDRLETRIQQKLDVSYRRVIAIDGSDVFYNRPHILSVPLHGDKVHLVSLQVFKQRCTTITLARIGDDNNNRLPFAQFGASLQGRPYDRSG